MPVARRIVAAGLAAVRQPPPMHYDWPMANGETGKVVFVLGAGASKECGCPLMAEFFAKAQDLYWRDKLGSARQDFDEVQHFRAYLQGAYSRAAVDPDNLEGVLTAIEMAEFLAEDKASIERLARTRTSLVRLIKATLEASTRFITRHEVIQQAYTEPSVWRQLPVEKTALFPVNSDRPHAHQSIAFRHPDPSYQALIQFMHALRQRAPVSRCDFVSFNYDLALEVALTNAGIPFDYGLVNGALVPEGACALMKLHGSLSWQHVNGKPPIEVPNWRNRIVLPGKPTDANPVPLEVDPVSQGSGTPETFIVPPTESKRERRALVDGVWKRAARLLREAEFIVFLSFSLPPTDVFFREFFALTALGSYSSSSDEPAGVLRKLIVVNPDPAVDERYRAVLSGQAARIARFLRMGMSDAVGPPSALVEKQMGLVRQGFSVPMESRPTNLQNEFGLA